MTPSGHTGTIRALVAIDGLRIWSCSSDKTIKLWNVSSGVCKRTLEGHTDWVVDILLLLDERLCSISYDSILKIWNIETGACELTAHVGNLSFSRVIQLHDGLLVVSDGCGVIFIIGG
jgi:WD40 repeat protein